MSMHQTASKKEYLLEENILQSVNAFQKIKNYHFVEEANKKLFL